ncbi:hypothetical protein TGAM01_v205864 [Trichoderma gamsii]|uniref:2EXR domain-containing protein n=1 Tax=Trichoderma gamsii TaxID=398673 RepID=A0A2P4ZLL2_9HYPO|nr:hypothetical protein TGAM01_v205864 [Trichoderma gamsii]PON25178.1 hypothetical protein TGAM01_v205864 [Trichoderma gamsii]
MSAEPIRFEIPDEYRTFLPFNRFPPEIRQQIWHESVSTPGMHFVKLESRGRHWRWISLNRLAQLITQQQNPEKDDDFDEIAHEVKNEVTPKRLWDTRLVPVSTNQKSDISSYHDLNKQMAALATICQESKAVADSLMAKQGALKLSNGKLVTLGGSSDIIFLEYFPPELFESGCGYDIDPNCPSLDNIKRVAVRYCHQWQEKPLPTVCSLCGLVHDTTGGVIYPIHLYHFLARHLPNVEEFYFVDYFLLRKSAQSSASPGKLPTRKYKCGNRTFYEANDEHWNVKPQVTKMQTWLQDRFVRYAKASQLSRHKNPEKVRFGVLACEWDIVPPLSLKAPPTPPAPKGRNKRMLYEEQALRRNRRRVLRQKSRNAQLMNSATFTANVPFVFGNPNNSMDFTFSVDWRQS